MKSKVVNSIREPLSLRILNRMYVYMAIASVMAFLVGLGFVINSGGLSVMAAYWLVMSQLVLLSSFILQYLHQKYVEDVACENELDDEVLGVDRNMQANTRNKPIDFDSPYIPESKTTYGPTLGEVRWKVVLAPKDHDE